MGYLYADASVGDFAGCWVSLALVFLAAPGFLLSLLAGADFAVGLESFGVADDGLESLRGAADLESLAGAVLLSFAGGFCAAESLALEGRSSDGVVGLLCSFAEGFRSDSDFLRSDSDFFRSDSDRFLCDLGGLFETGDFG